MLIDKSQFCKSDHFAKRNNPLGEAEHIKTDTKVTNVHERVALRCWERGLRGKSLVVEHPIVSSSTPSS
jgi:hypothetical protein